MPIPAAAQNPEVSTVTPLVKSVSHAILGVAGIILNMFQLTFAVASVFLILPRLSMLQKDLDIPSTSTTSTLALSGLMVLAFALLCLSILVVAKKITNSKLVIGILVASSLGFTALIVATIITIIYPIYNLTTSIEKSPTQTPQNLPTPTPSEWKTYTKPTFTFKYPPEWKIKEESATYVEIIPTNANVNPQIDGGTNSVAYGIMIFIDPNDSRTPEKYWQDKKDEGRTRDKSYKKSVSINGANGLQVRETRLDAHDITTILSRDNILYLIQQNYYLNTTEDTMQRFPEAEKEMTQILSTFKFTDNTNTVACTMDAKICPDGSYVGRTGSKCEFVCPTGTSAEGKACGGIAGETGSMACPTGYYCKYPTPHGGDMPGVCTK